MSGSLMILSTTMKNIFSLPKHLSITRLYYSNQQAIETVTNVKSESATSRQLFELIKRDNNPVSLTALIQANKNTIDGRHIVLALTSMQKFYEANSIDPFVIKKSVQFQNMCSILKSQVMKLDLPEVIQSIKILNLLKVQGSTVIVQSLLQIIRSSINDLSLQQIYYLSFLLKSMEPTNLSEAIMVALPEVFKAQLKLQIDKESLTELKNALRYTKDYVSDKEIMAYLVKAILNIQTPMDIDSAVHILWSLADIRDPPENYVPLLYNLFSIVKKDINLLNDVEIMKTIVKISKKVADGFDEFYDPHFLDILINRSVTNNFGFAKNMIILKKINRLKHINIQLLDYLSNRYDEQSLKENPSNILTLMNGLSRADYKPSSWNKLQEFIINNYSVFPDHVALCYLAFYLASFSYYDPKILKIVFTSDDNPNLLSNSYRQTLHDLYKSVKTLYPEYSGPWPIEGLFDSLMTLNPCSEPRSASIFSALNKILGGSTYFMTNAKTKLGHEIDHLIIMRDGNPIPIPLSDSNNYIEDLEIPSDTRRVAVLVLTPEVYGRNIKRLMSTVSLNMRSLEAMSYTVVKVSMEEWSAMPDDEKLPFLKSLIGLQNQTKVEAAKKS